MMPVCLNVGLYVQRHISGESTQRVTVEMDAIGLAD